MLRSFGLVLCRDLYKPVSEHLSSIRACMVVVREKVECLALLKFGVVYFSFHFWFVSLKDEKGSLKK